MDPAPFTILDAAPRPRKGARKASADHGLDLRTEDFLRMWEAMVRVRALDERGLMSQRQGRIGFYVPSTGEEGHQIGAAYALRADDWCFPSYRVPGVAVFRGAPLSRMVANLFGNRDDFCLGRQMPNHYSFREQNFVSISSPLGTQIPQAVGVARAMQIRGERVDGLGGQGRLARLDAREIQDVVDELQEVLAALQDLVDSLPLPLGDRLPAVAPEELGEPEHGVERRPELVAHRRQELALGLAARLGGAPGVAELLGQPHVLGQVPHRLDHAALGRAAIHDPQVPAVASSHVVRAPGLTPRSLARFQERQALPVAREMEILGPGP